MEDEENAAPEPEAQPEGEDEVAGAAAVAEPEEEGLDGGVRIGQIRSAIRTIRGGVKEIDAVFLEARGPLSKTVVRGLHQRIKELRKTAEVAEEAFRDWTLDLAGRPRCAEHAEHDELHGDFEAEVAGIQKSMLRIADEVRRRQSSRKAQAAEEAAEQSEVGEDAAQAAAAPVPAPQPVPPRRMPVATVRTAEERANSHAAVASTLRSLASQEEVVRLDRTPRQPEHLTVPLANRNTMPLKEKIGGMHPYMKYILGIALVIVGYTLYSHARLVIIHTSMQAEPHEAVLPAPPRRLR